jgi:hypothetical protein
MDKALQEKKCLNDIEMLELTLKDIVERKVGIANITEDEIGP